MLQALKDFLKFEASSGILLILATVLAMLVVNSPLEQYYNALLGTTAEIRLGTFSIEKPLLLWINDGLMAIFFFLIGLEVKREMLAGELSDPARIVLPVIGAIGGMAMPAIIYLYINWGDPVAMKGWAIPSATDIAFALGVLALLGSRIPASLKLFLMTLAIIDDLGAIVIIAIFYTDNLSMASLSTAIVAIIALFALNRFNVIKMTPYLLVGLVLWTAVLKSGIHATLAGVIIAFFIPFKKMPCEAKTQLEIMEHDLHPAVSFAILPIFAFANTGISFDGLTFDMLLHPVPLGIALGLFLGNQLGIFTLCYLTIKMGIAKMPSHATFVQIYGVALLCGIGFTMSLFIGSLAFEQGGPAYNVDERLGILMGSLISAVAGYIVLYLSSNPDARNAD
jgi:NhaA family Na+:H+ antiporter